MRLGTIKDLCEALGGVGETYASALKKAAGLTGSRLFDIDVAIKFRSRNPNWKMTDVYKKKTTSQSRPRSRSGRLASVAGKSDAQS